MPVLGLPNGRLGCNSSLDIRSVPGQPRIVPGAHTIAGHGRGFPGLFIGAADHGGIGYRYVQFCGRSALESQVDGWRIAASEFLAIALFSFKEAPALDKNPSTPTLLISAPRIVSPSTKTD